MDIQVLAGSLLEVPALDATGMDRRAFGESWVLATGSVPVSAASYWTAHPFFRDSSP